MRPNHEQVVVIFMTAFILTVGAVYFIYIHGVDEERELEWSVGADPQGAYWIVIESTEPRHLDAVHFRIEDPDGSVTTVVDPSGDVIRLEGRLSDIVLDWDDREAAQATGWPNATYDTTAGYPYFYSGVPGGRTNLTLYTVLYVRGERFTTGDFMLVRSAEIGGSVDEGHRLVLTVPDRDERMGTISFPQAIRPVIVRNRENGGDYRFRIMACHPWPLEDVEYNVLDRSRLIDTWDDPSNEEIRIEGGLHDINFTQHRYSTADRTYRGIFFSREPAGSPPFSRNHSLTIVYLDNDSDGLMSSNDALWIRGRVNGGTGEDLYRLRLVHTERDFALMETELTWIREDLDLDIRTVNGSYRVDIVNASGGELDEISYTLYDPQGKNVSVTDPSGRTVRLVGVLDDINHTEWDNDTAHLRHPPVFYSRDPRYHWESDNQTLYVVFQDIDLNARLTTSDKIWIRSVEEGGAADSGYTLELVNGRTGKPYTTITFL